MTRGNNLPQSKIPWISRFIFYLCAFYFFFMGFSLIFFPVFITKGISGNEISPAIIDLPFELVSISGIIIMLIKIKAFSGTLPGNQGGANNT